MREDVSCARAAAHAAVCVNVMLSQCVCVQVLQGVWHCTVWCVCVCVCVCTPLAPDSCVRVRVSVCVFTTQSSRAVCCMLLRCQGHCVQLGSDSLDGVV